MLFRILDPFYELHRTGAAVWGWALQGRRLPSVKLDSYGLVCGLSSLPSTLRSVCSSLKYSPSNDSLHCREYIPKIVSVVRTHVIYQNHIFGSCNLHMAYHINSFHYSSIHTHEIKTLHSTCKSQNHHLSKLMIIFQLHTFCVMESAWSIDNV